MSRRRRRCGLTWWSLALAILVSLEGVTRADLWGDYNENGVLDAGDLDLHGQCDGRPDHDLNGDGPVNYDDRLMWVHELKGTWIGDANFDGQFNSGDFVQVFSAGKFETGEEAGWEQGDWSGDHTFSSGDLVAAFVDGGYEQGPRPILGDYNRNGLLDAGDLDLQAIAMTLGPAGPEYDLNEDGSVDYADRQFWVDTLKKTWIGDVNLDGEVDTSDLVQIFAGGKYQTDEIATWAQGDVNGDMKFTSSDLVAIYIDWPSKDPRPGRLAATVPEPGAGMSLTLGLMLAFSKAGRRVFRWKPVSRRAWITRVLTLDHRSR